MAAKPQRKIDSGEDLRRPSADFPKHTLEAALKVPQGLEDNNGGNPLPPMDLAVAIGSSPGSSAYRDLLSSSIKYGLTSGSFNGAKVSVEELGRDIVSPKSEEERRDALVSSALKPELFGKIYQYFKGKKIPEVPFFVATLSREFGVVKDIAPRAVEIFTANMQYLKAIKETSTGKWLTTDLHSVRGEATSLNDETENLEPRLEYSSLETKGSSREPEQRAPSRNAIFVGHGKNRRPVEQLEKILNEYKLPYKLAVEEPNKGRPISQKVADIMHECGSAIIIFTADEEFHDSNANVVYRPSENAIFELGAASALYGSRIIIFRESRVQFPTNFRDIGYITFDEDQLSAKVNELFRELIGFRLIKVSVAS